jgi:hypothetical protein
MKKVDEFELPKSKEQWISAAVLKETFLVCGDRNGSIHLFKVDGNRSCNLQVYKTVSSIPLLLLLT